MLHSKHFYHSLFLYIYRKALPMQTERFVEKPITSFETRFNNNSSVLANDVKRLLYFKFFRYIKSWCMHQSKTT